MSTSENCRWKQPGVRWTETDAREALAVHAASGLALEEFADQHGLKGRRVRTWLQRLGLLEPSRPVMGGVVSKLVPMVVRHDTETSSGSSAGVVVMRIGRFAIEVHVPGKVDPSWLAQLMVEIGRAQ